MRLRILLTCALVCALAGAASAQTKTSGTITCAKPDPAYSIEVGDLPGHSFEWSKTACTWTKPMEIGGSQTKDGYHVASADANGTKARISGYHVSNMSNGDKIFVRFSGTDTMTKDGRPESASGTWSYTGGTGKLTGIKGKGTYTGKANADGSITYEFNGEYEIPIALLPVRAYLHRGEPAPHGLGAYGYLVFTKRPSDSDKTRYAFVCDSFRRNLEPLAEYGKTNPSSIMVTFWPLVSAKEMKSRVPGCDLLIQEYDYALANLIAGSVGKLGGKGPILVAWPQPFLSKPLDDALILDVSDFAEEDLDRALGVWKDRIASNPATWRKGFNLVLAREAFRNFIQKYGEQIVSMGLAGK